MKLKQLLDQLNQLAKERPEALNMEVYASTCCDYNCVSGVEIHDERFHVSFEATDPYLNQK